MPSTIPHVRPPDNSPLVVEADLRALRQAAWVALYLAHPLPWPDLSARCSALLREVDRLLEELDL